MLGLKELESPRLEGLEEKSNGGWFEDDRKEISGDAGRGGLTRNWGCLR